MENNTTTNTDLKVIYKCLFITRKEDDKYRIIHGRIIKWICNDLDTINLEIKKYKTDHKFYVFTFDGNNNPFENGDKIKKKFEKTLLVDGKDYHLFFNWTENDDDAFLSLGYEQKVYNPFVGYSTKCSVLYTPLNDIKSYEIVNKYNNTFVKDIEKIEKNSGINLIKNPELINSFIYYEPYRITSKFKGFKKDKNGFKISIDDEFNQYGDYDVIIKYFIDEKEYNVSFKVGLRIKEEIADDVPDKVDIKIEKDNKLIYREVSSIIKKINLKFSYPDKNIIIGDKKIEQYSSKNINIGEE